MHATDPQKGKLLIAEPSLTGDLSFNRSIVLLAEHNTDGSVGFILNKPLEYNISDLVDDISANFEVYNGGPVEQDNLYFIHKVPHLIEDSVEISNGIYWGGNFEKIVSLINNNKISKEDIRFFLGYSGWGKHQLIDELNINSWFISENDIKNIFSNNNDSMWRTKILQKGGDYKLWANAPNDIQLN